MAPDTSVIIRVRDEQATLDRCLRLLADQQLPDRAVEVIVVDCGSSDSTVALATAHGARVIELPPARFTFGGALNLGAESAHGTAGHLCDQHDQRHAGLRVTQSLSPVEAPKWMALGGCS